MLYKKVVASLSTPQTSRHRMLVRQSNVMTPDTASTRRNSSPLVKVESMTDMGKTPVLLREVTEDTLASNKRNAERQGESFDPFGNKKDDVPQTGLPRYSSELSSRPSSQVERIDVGTTVGHRSENQDRYYCTEFAPWCSFFAVYDGHGTSEVAEMLADPISGLHTYVWDKVSTLEEMTDLDIVGALQEAFCEMDKAIIEKLFAQSSIGNLKRGGSTASVVLRVNGKTYVANVGDSRVVVRSGDSVVRGSLEPYKQDEIGRFEYIELPADRITHFKQKERVLSFNKELDLGVTSAFGDIVCETSSALKKDKFMEKMGGKLERKVISSVPRVTVFEDATAVFLCSDGVEMKDADAFDKASGSDGVKGVLEASYPYTEDNITGVFVAFKSS